MSDYGKAHATLSPSSAERWLNCPASIRMIASLDHEEETSPWAEEGTRAHDLGEIEAAYVFGLTSEAEYTKRKSAWVARAEELGDDIEEMERHIAGYVSLLQDLHAGLSEEGPVVVRLEERVQTGVPGCWGTADAVLIGLTRVEVVDLKYGAGVRVQAVKNPQLMLYSVGSLELVDLLGTIETVGMHIFQPRAGGQSHYSMSATDLRAWRDDEVIPAARATQNPDARFGPSEEACRWCPAAGVCGPRMQKVTQRDFGNPDLLTEDELAKAVLSISEIRDWCNAVEAEALHQAYSEGKTLPGLKVVLSGGKRSITDEEKAINTLTAAGFTEDQVARRKVQTLTTLEKVVGKQRLPEILGDLLAKGAGKPALVPEDDSRTPISPASEAAKDFQSEG